MNFLEAVKAMKEGKKVTNKTYCRVYYWITEDDKIKGESVDGDARNLFTSEMLLDTWKIVEKETLSNKIVAKETVPCLQVKDVKEAIKDIKEDVEKAYKDADSDTGLSDLEIEGIIDKRIGEKLT